MYFRGAAGTAVKTSPSALTLQVPQKYELPKQMVSFDEILANFLAVVDISFHVWAET